MVGGFLVAPPYGLDTEGWYKYGVFLVTILAGLWLVPIRAWSQKKFMWRWWMVATSLAVISTAALLYYTSLLDSWTVLYFRTDRVVIGKTLTSDARIYASAMRLRGEPVDDLRLLQEYGGNASSVWDPNEITGRQRLLTYWYLSSLLLLSSAAITVTEAVYSTTSGSEDI